MNIRGTLLLISLYVLCASTIPQRHRRKSKNVGPPKATFCGSNLTTTMNLVCRGNYYGKTKRGGGGVHNDDFEELSESYIEANEEEYRYPFIPRELAESLVPLKVRRYEEEDITITEECCYKSCTIEELRTYCG